MQTPEKDLRDSTLKHYEEAATSIDYYSSIIPKAINYYFDMISDEPLSIEDIEAEGFERYKNANSFYKGVIHVFLHEDGQVDINDEEKTKDIGYPYHLFEGFVKNRFEFKKILEQLKIK